MAATEVADSLGYCLKAEQKQAILPFVDGVGVFIFLSTGHEVMTSNRTTKALCKSSIPTLHTLHNNCITLPQLVGWSWLARLAVCVKGGHMPPSPLLGRKGALHPDASPACPSVTAHTAFH